MLVLRVSCLMQSFSQLVGSCETTFKKRFSNHKKSFNLKEYKNKTIIKRNLVDKKFRSSPKS